MVRMRWALVLAWGALGAARGVPRLVRSEFAGEKNAEIVGEVLAIAERMDAFMRRERVSSVLVGVREGRSVDVLEPPSLRYDAASSDRQVIRAAGRSLSESSAKEGKRDEQIEARKNRRDEPPPGTIYKSKTRFGGMRSEHLPSTSTYIVKLGAERSTAIRSLFLQNRDILFIEPDSEVELRQTSEWGRQWWDRFVTHLGGTPYGQELYGRSPMYGQYPPLTAGMPYGPPLGPYYGPYGNRPTDQNRYSSGQYEGYHGDSHSYPDSAHGYSDTYGWGGSPYGRYPDEGRIDTDAGRVGDKPEQIAKTARDRFYNPKQWSLVRGEKFGIRLHPQVDELRARGGGRRTLVAVIDTGLDMAHADIPRAGVHRNRGEVPANGRDDDGNGLVDDVHGWDFGPRSAGRAWPADPDGHGTHIAGIIVADGSNRKGVAGICTPREVRILPLRFARLTSEVLRALSYAVAARADIINNSWGYRTLPLALERALRTATESGAALVCAVDNAGKRDAPDFPPDLLLRGQVNVASSTRAGALARGSSWGRSAHLAAPGERVFSTLPGGYGYKSGTSMAAPHVTAVLALLMHYLPACKRDQLIRAVVKGVTKTEELEGKVKSGGILNFAKAYRVAKRICGEVAVDEG